MMMEHDGNDNNNILKSLTSFGNLKPSQIQSPFLQPGFSLPENISSEFIVPEGVSRNRGRFELAFSQIGTSIMIGSSIGGTIGTYKGLLLNLLFTYLTHLDIIFGIGIREVSKLEALISIKRTQLLNYITRNGASMANTFGVITLTYSAIGVGLSFVQEENDDINTLISAVATGALYGGVSQPKTIATNLPSEYFQLNP